MIYSIYKSSYILKNLRLLEILGQKLRYHSGQSMKVSAVVFDMGGVVMPSPIEFFSDFEYQFRLPRGTIVQTIGGNSWKLLEAGEMKFDYKFGELLAEECVERTNQQLNARAFVDGLLSLCKPHSYPIMVEAIKRLRAAGIRTALLTNNFVNDERPSVFIDPSLFDVVVESSKTGVRKPEERIFKITLERLGSPPASEVVMLDDFKVNVDAAALLGMNVIKVNNPRKALLELQEMTSVRLLEESDCSGLIGVPERLTLNEENLQKYLEEELKMDGGAEKPSVKLFEHGQSNPTYLIRYAGQKIVLRKKPPGALLKSAHQVEREYKFMEALGKSYHPQPPNTKSPATQHHSKFHPFSPYLSSSVPVPKLLSICTDESVLGTTFYTMEHMEGLVMQDHMMPGMPPMTKRKVMLQMCQILANLHKVDYANVGLQGYATEGSFISRNVKLWMKLYQMAFTGLDEMNAANHKIDLIPLIYDWLTKRLPTNEMKTLIHGDYRLDNMIIDSTTHDITAVIDWEMATVGDPITDVVASCLPQIINFPSCYLPAFDLSSPEGEGLLSMDEYIKTYLQIMNINEVSIDWQFYCVNCLFRYSCILHGVFLRHIKGQSSSSNSNSAFEDATKLAHRAWEIANDVTFSLASISGTSSVSSSGVSPASSSGVSPASLPTPPSGVSGKSASVTPSDKSRMTPMPLTIHNFDQPVIDLYNQVCRFIEVEVMPVEEAVISWSREAGNAWKVCPQMEELKEKARNQGLWNLFINKEMDPKNVEGKGLTNLQYAFFAEKMGWSLIAPEVFNCSAPDTGNMEVLMKYANKEQQQMWLQPLLEGKIRSCFAMTEPDVASSDASNIESPITRDQDHYVINGRKWWTSGAMDPRCKMCIFMGRTNPSAPPHQQHSLVIVPMEAEGFTVVRHLTVFGYDHSPNGHAELSFKNVRVPLHNLILGEGRGFEMGQGRLGPGRLHHCMRCLGAAERSLQLMLHRAQNRRAFKQALIEQGTVQRDIAEARIKIEQARLLVLKTAHAMDLLGSKGASLEIAMIKAEVPRIACEVIDRAMQVHGGMGLCGDTPLPHLYTMARVLRVADGPDEVHYRSIAKMMIKELKG